ELLAGALVLTRIEADELIGDGVCDLGRGVSEADVERDDGRARGNQGRQQCRVLGARHDVAAQLADRTVRTARRIRVVPGDDAGEVLVGQHAFRDASNPLFGKVRHRGTYDVVRYL